MKNRKHLDRLYSQAQGNVYGAVQLLAGELGIFNIFYGHKVDANKKKKLHRAQVYLEQKYLN